MWMRSADYREEFPENSLENEIAEELCDLMPDACPNLSNEFFRSHSVSLVNAVLESLAIKAEKDETVGVMDWDTSVWIRKQKVGKEQQ